MNSHFESHCTKTFAKMRDWTEDWVGIKNSIDVKNNYNHLIEKNVLSLNPGCWLLLNEY